VCVCVLKLLEFTQCQLSTSLSDGRHFIIYDVNVPRGATYQQ